jgi:uncharacterized membrane protein YeaQ/YmgE (transglycosylase-associated protein family)
MSIIAILLVGLIVGAIARLLVPGPDSMGILATIALGIGGALLASFLGHALGWYALGEGPGLLGSLVGAVLVLVAAHAVARR